MINTGKPVNRPGFGWGFLLEPAMWWKKLVVLGCLIGILLIGRWIGNYESDRAHAGEIADLRKEKKDLIDSKADALKEQKNEMDQQRNDEVKRLTSMCSSAAAEAFRAAQAAASVTQSASQAAKEQVEAIKKASGDTK